MITNRTTLYGRQAEYRQRLQVLKIEIDTAAKGILLHFDPMDQDLEYVKNIMPERLRVNVATIEKKMKEFHKTLSLLKEVNEQLGESGE